MLPSNHQQAAWLEEGVREGQVSAGRLALDVSVLARGLGYHGPGVSDSPDEPHARHGRRTMPDHMAELAETALAQGLELLAPRWAWRPLVVGNNGDKDSLLYETPCSGRLAVGKLVKSQLRGSQAAVVFVVTIGSQLEVAARTLLREGNSLEGYVLDTVGSMAVEAVADEMEVALRAEIAALGWGITNRFSPGYCTWPTGDQHNLFALFPAPPAGVSLTASALMYPIKSISGVIGLGETVEHRPYTCEFCSMTTCHQRLTTARL